MTREVIEQAIVDVLRTVPEIGVVSPNNMQLMGSMTIDQIYEAFALTGPDDVLRFCTLYRKASPQDDSNTRFGSVALGQQIWREHNFEIVVYEVMLLNDPGYNAQGERIEAGETRTINEEGFQRRLDAIIGAFDSEASLRGFTAYPIQLVDVSPDEIQNRLAYSATFTLIVVENVQVQRRS